MKLERRVLFRNYSPIINNGLVISDILLLNEYIAVSSNYLALERTSDECSQASRERLHHVTINKQGDHTSDNIYI